MATTVTFGDYTISDDFICSNIDRQFIPRELSTIDVPGMDGAILSNVRNTTLSISIDVTALGTPQERSAKFRMLAQKLAAESPKLLGISDDKAPSTSAQLYYRAVASGGELARLVGAESVTIEFTCLSPAMEPAVPTGYHSDTLPTSFELGGTYPASAVTIKAKSATAGNDGLFTLEVGGHSISFEVDGTADLIVKADTRSATFGGNAILPTLASDWPVLEPGTVEVGLSSGTASSIDIQYKERWL